MLTTSKQADAEQEQRTALVTGSSNGIGEAIAKQLAKLNYKLVVTGRDAEDIKRVADQCAVISSQATKPLEVVADLEKETEVDRLFELTMEHFDNKLNLLVNNAGFGLPIPHTQTDLCYATFKRIMQINLNAVVRLTLLAAPILKRTAESTNETSSIVNVGSIAGFRPAGSLFAYGTSKAALNMFTSSMAVELAPLVRVNCVSPGPVETKIIERSGFSLDVFKQMSADCAPLNRVGQVDEIAQSVLFLANPQQASYIAGANLIVDGGTMLAPFRWSP